MPVFSQMRTGWAARASRLARATSQRLNLPGSAGLGRRRGDVQAHRILARADLHILPSRKEGWGLAVIEAGLHGVPTLGYHSSAGLRDSVVDGITGVLVNSEGGLINTLGQLLEDPSRLATLGAAARERAGTFSWQRTGAAWEELLTGLME